MADILIAGAGVIGLSIAWELAQRGLSVEIIDPNGVGQEASWAGAGMLPPGHPDGARTPEARLRAASDRLWDDWAARLVEASGIDIGYRRDGGLDVYPVSREATAVEAFRHWQAEHVPVTWLEPSGLKERFPALGPPERVGYWLPRFGQVRNPRLIKALGAACSRAGVVVRPGVALLRVEPAKGRIASVTTSQGREEAGEYIVAAGAWSQPLLGALGVDVPVRPVRGQMVLLNLGSPSFNYVVQEGLRYIVPRADGRVLVGATEEHAGFQKRTTAVAVESLLHFAQTIVPELADASLERTWSGLRPGGGRDYPWLGRLPDYENLSVAVGHYRSGLQMSPITATLLRQNVLGEKPTIDLSPYRASAGVK